MHGSRLSAAISCARRCFFTVIGKYVPPFTVASLRDHDARLAVDGADAGDDAGAGGDAVVEILRGEGRELEERRAGVDQPFDTRAGRELAPCLMLRDRVFAAAPANSIEADLQILHQRLHRRRVVTEGLRAGVDVCGQSGHRSSATPVGRAPFGHHTAARAARFTAA